MHQPTRGLPYVFVLCVTGKLRQGQQPFRPDGALEMIRFSFATNISPQWGSMFAVIFPDSFSSNRFQSQT